MKRKQEANLPAAPTIYQSVYTFAKAQASAFIGGLFDYGLMILLTEYGHLHYTKSIVISGMFGAIVNFSLNRYWTFKAHDVSKRTQLAKFVVVVLGSIALKSSGTYMLTELLHLDYKISRLCIDAVVSLGFNFTLQKYWVFKKPAEVE
ncbi:MAG TPA: GtrA family protein [Chitinophagales bacterium]|nr:GtrA family protein [Chitinophagales bacterium]